MKELKRDRKIVINFTIFYHSYYLFVGNVGRIIKEIII